MNGPIERTRVLIVGSGFSGIGAAVRLKQAGVQDFVIVERAEDLGGTWRDNTYPGLCCDIPSHLYSYSFELNPSWKRGFADGSEILEYLRDTAVKHGVTDHIRYGHEVTAATWQESESTWRVETTRADFEADFVIFASGALSNPMIPEIPGRESFEGSQFHSATWDHDYELSGKRVAVIGTGASAIQFVPQIQPLVESLTVFQRTPPWIVPRLDHDTRAWEKRMLTRIPGLAKAVRGAIYGSLEARVLGFRHPRMMGIAAALARWHMKRQVKDPGLREKLTPDYTIGCKRILISDNFYPSLTRENVDLVTEGVGEIKPASIVTVDGTEFDVDTIIWGTGFYVTEFPIASAISGREGKNLGAVWQEGAEAYLGVNVAGFPNLFLMLGPNSGLGHNSMVYMIESQINLIIDSLAKMDRLGARSFDVRKGIQDEFNQEVQTQTEGTVWSADHCSSWYLDKNGKNRSLWPEWTFRYRQRTRRFRSEKYELK